MSTDSVECVEVHGDLDMMSSPTVVGLLRRLFEDGATRVVLDLADVPFLDSMGVAAVVAAHVEARDRDARFVCVAGGQLDRFVRMGLDGILLLAESRELAIARLHE